ncbi:hypothetical protein [Chroococcidiopsis sp.]|uniref:hypothetical protein n=1 Tax=Chroococcidiopsis sp. TaxID=3088168 RepID=UPI003F32D6DC
MNLGIKVTLTYNELVYEKPDVVLSNNPEADKKAEEEAKKKGQEVKKDTPEPKVTLGKKKTLTFESGKDIYEVTTSEGIGERVNACSIAIFDPDLKLASMLRERSILAGGIEVPEDLFEKEKDEQKSSGVSGKYEVKEGLKGDDLARQVINYCRAMTPPLSNNHIAAILGTMTIESNDGEHLEEIGGEGKYDFLPNGKSAHGKGLVQITWRENFEKMSKELNHDFVNNPDDLKKLEWAIPAMCIGMVKGLFTSWRLKDFGD